MSLVQLDELLQRALAELQADALTIVTLDEPNKLLLPESYWLNARELGVAGAAHILDADALRRRRREEDEALANASVDELLDDAPKLWKPLEATDWGTRPMRTVWGGTTKRPTEGDVQPVYNHYCQWCYRPITEEDDAWKDHNNKEYCPDHPYAGDHLPDGMTEVSDDEEDDE